MAADERDREIAARCMTVERACAALGYSPGSRYERIAVLVAKVAGYGSLRRTIAEIAADREIKCSYRHAKRALEEFQRDGVLSVQQETAAPTRRRGRPPNTLHVAINWDSVRRIIREFERQDDQIRYEVSGQNKTRSTSDELTASDRHRTGIGPASDRHRTGIGSASDAHTLYPPNNPLTHGPQSPAAAENEGGARRKEDHKLKIVSKAATEPTAIRLCRALNWPSGDVQTLWRVAAAFDCGLLTEWSIKDACKAAVELADTTRVGYFRTTLAGNCDLDLDGLKNLLSSVVMPGGFPEDSPDRPQEPVREQIRHQPSAAKQHSVVVAALVESMRMDSL